MMSAFSATLLITLAIAAHSAAAPTPSTTANLSLDIHPVGTTSPNVPEYVPNPPEADEQPAQVPPRFEPTEQPDDDEDDDEVKPIPLQFIVPGYYYPGAYSIAGYGYPYGGHGGGGYPYGGYGGYGYGHGGGGGYGGGHHWQGYHGHHGHHGR